MPWKETNTMDLRKKFIHRMFAKKESFTELCKEFGISTKTGYKWKERLLKYGWEGLCDQSRRPRNNRNEIPEEIVLKIIKIKNQKPNWGSYKILKVFTKNNPDVKPPALSSVERIMEKAGLRQKRKRKRYLPSQRIQNRFVPKQPNDLWTVDFKGWWYSKKKEKVNPLTVRDEYSKYILAITVMERGDISCVENEFRRLFKKHGLPLCIRSDNGPPFACKFNSLGLTKLSAWWMSLGITLDRIDPGCPYQNGSHERMHLDMKRELEGQIDGSLNEHQRVFDKWREEYNTERPHEALGMKCPSDCYQNSERKYTPEITDIEYPRIYKPRKVNDRGFFNYEKKRYFIGNPFAGYTIGIRVGKEKTKEIWFDKFMLGNLDLSNGLIEYKMETKLKR
jgi:transposase InsO family protein